MIYKKQTNRGTQNKSENEHKTSMNIKSMKDEELKKFIYLFQIWQHTDCMRVKGDEDNYLCEECEPRPVNLVCHNSDKCWN